MPGQAFIMYRLIDRLFISSFSFPIKTLPLYHSSSDNKTQMNTVKEYLSKQMSWEKHNLLNKLGLKGNYHGEQEIKITKNDTIWVIKIENTHKER